MPRATGQMIHSAFQKLHPIVIPAWEQISSVAREDYQRVANILNGQLNPERILYVLTYSDLTSEPGESTATAENVEQLVGLIRDLCPPSDYLRVSIKNEQGEEYGRGEYYLSNCQDGLVESIEAVEEIDAALGLGSEINELALVLIKPV